MVRKATLGDIPKIRQMAEAVFPETYKNILSGEQIRYMMDMMYSEMALKRQMTVDNNTFHLCEGRGYVSFRYVGKTEDCSDLFHIEKLYVLPEFQGLGVGRELMETVINAVRKTSNGTARIELNVNRYNNKAVSFYEHMGMRRDRRGDFPIGNGFFMNDYIMRIDFQHNQSSS